ncbi:MAG: DUF2147 domain-containing protein [Pseudolabrys sp.]|nr:DUF2147 domain-containing protein [Pseudolabrys sp.]
MRGKAGPWGGLAALLIAGGLAHAQEPPPAATDPTGEWLVAERVAHIEIVNCEGRYWGVVSWEMKPGVDSHNPDPGLRSRPTLGMPVLLGMTQTGSNRWEGRIYNAKDGRTYSATMTLLDADTLRVEGCFLGFLCGGENWTRVAAPVALAPSGTMPKRGAPPDATRPSPSGPLGAPDQICSRLIGAPGLSHERGLK